MGMNFGNCLWRASQWRGLRIRDSQLLARSLADWRAVLCGVAGRDAFQGCVDSTAQAEFAKPVEFVGREPLASRARINSAKSLIPWL